MEAILRLMLGKKRLTLFVAIPAVAAVSIAIGIYLYYLLMPAFIQLTVLPIELAHPTAFRDTAGFTDADLQQFPSLKQAMQIAENNYHSMDKKTIPATVGLPNNEAKQLAQRLYMHPSGGDAFIYYYKDVVNGKKQPENEYSISISIGYNFRLFRLPQTLP